MKEIKYAIKILEKEKFFLAPFREFPILWEKEEWAACRLFIQHYLYRFDFKIPSLLSYYCFNQFLEKVIPEHLVFYHNQELPPFLKKEYQKKIIEPLQIIFQNDQSHFSSIEQFDIPYLEEKKRLYQSFLEQKGEELFSTIQAIFSKIGGGFFSRYYYWEWDQKLKGVGFYEPKKLENLKGYEEQKKIVLENTEKWFYNRSSFCHGFLYGSRGTGKTSLLFGLLEKWKKEGLRLIRIHKQNIDHLMYLSEKLKKRKEKFILLLDDISYEEQENIYKKHKQALDSFFDRKAQNQILYATSNSQEIVKFFRQETTQNMVIDNRNEEEKKLELPHRQVYDERRAFTERFGLFVFFGRVEEKNAKQILEFYQQHYGIQEELEELWKKYQTWVAYYGGINGRTIKHFVEQIVIKNF